MLLNRKLIIAVLTIGLMLSFSSAAIGYDDTKLKPLTPIPSLSRGQLIDAPTLVSIRNSVDIAKPTTGNDLPAGFIAFPGTRMCQDMDYTGGSFAYGYMIPSAYNEFEFGNKFVPAAACTVNAIGIAHYGAWMEGTPDVTVTLWAGPGSGYPATAVNSWAFPYASLSSAPQYLSVDLTAEAGYPGDYMFGANDEFFVTVSAVNGRIGVLAGDQVFPYELEAGVTLYDDGVDPAMWLTMDESGWGSWGEGERAFVAYADVCYEDDPMEGNCSYYQYDCGAAWLFGLSVDASNGETHYGVRFTAAEPETLKYVDIAFYDVIDDLGNSMWDGFPTAGTLPTGRVDICEPALTGGPNIATPLHTILLNDFEMDWWTTIDMVDGEGVTLIMSGDYYVVVSIDGVTSNADYNGLEEIDLLGDDGSCNAGRSGLFADAVPGVWLAYGTGYNFLMNVEACADAYSTCFWNWGPYGSYSYLWVIPGFLDSGDLVYCTGAAVEFSPALAGCDMGEIDIWFYGGSMAEDAEVAVYASDGPDGLPGTRLQYIPITGGSWPSGNFPLVSSVYFETSIWIALESFATADDDIELITDDGSFPSGRSAVLADIEGAGAAWAYWTDIFTSEYNWVMDIYQCCYPFVVRTCAPDGDWPTMGKDFARTGSTLNEMGDMQCELTKSWTYLNSSGNACTFAQPIIADGKVYAYMFDCLVCVDITNGDEIWRRDINFAEIGGSCRATPTYHDGDIYCGGGDNGYFARFNGATGATVWSFAMGGHAQYAPHVIMDVEGTEIIFVGDGLGNIYGLQTADGANFYDPGTTNPVYTVSGQMHKALTSDGTYLYAGCDEYLTTPNIFRLAVAASGLTVDWDLDSGVGWQLQTLAAGWPRPEASQEGQYANITYVDEGGDGQWLYFVSSYSPQNQSPVNNGGIIYKVSADGTTLGWAGPTNGGGGSLSGIVNDKAQVIWGGFNGWIGGSGQFAGPNAYAKTTGLPQWGPTGEEPNWTIQDDPSQADVYAEVVMPGVLTCESIADPAVNDVFVYGNFDGYWNFVDATLGEMVWNRRDSRFITYVTGPVVDGAGHMILGAGPKLHCMANAGPRGRFHIVDMAPELPVPFGLPSYYEIVFENVYMNTGCADLEIFHVELLEEDNGTFPTMLHQVDPDRADAISAIAKKNTGLTEKMVSAVDQVADGIGFSKSNSSPAAYALPAYITSVLEPADNTILGAGEYGDIRLAINGELVPRGASSVFAEFHTDDMDYFLDSAYMDYGDDAADPTILLTVVGGCLYNSMPIEFGDGQANHYPVWNSTLIMESNSGNYEIDGISAYLYGCDGLFYSVDTERVVMHAFDGGGAPIWESILPDPLPTCDFAVEYDRVLAQMSDDGSAYSNVLGTMINYAYVDSMEDHRVYTIDDEVDPPETTITWEWDVETNTGLNKPYSNELTEGWAFKAHVTEYAVTDVVGPKYGFDDFWAFTISRHAVYSRYGTAIPGLFVGMIADWDVDTYEENTTGYSEEYSVSWIYDPTSIGPHTGSGMPDFGGGVVKVPFGPGYTPCINSVDATTAWYGGEEPGFDSIYVWMSRESTQFMNYQPYPLGTDRRMWTSITELNLPAWSYTGSEDDPIPPEAFETYGYALFGLHTPDMNAGNVANYIPMATLINKFCGFGRGDTNDDGAINLVDIVYLNNFVHGGGNGPFPFKHLGDVNNDGDVDGADITYMVNWYFYGGPAPLGEWALPQYVTP